MSENFFENFFVIDMIDPPLVGVGRPRMTHLRVGATTRVSRLRRMHLQDLDHTASDWDNDCLYWWGCVLTGVDRHWCHDWDGLPIDNTCEEYEACHCGGAD
jgi:hypothetical protein